MIMNVRAFNKTFVLQAKEQQMIEMAKCGMTNDVTVTIFKILENLSLC